MDASQREKLKLLFEQALALPSEARAAFVAEACGADAALRDELTSLLRAYASSSGYFEELAERIVAPALAAVGGGAADELAPGETVARYEILARIGGGAMGDVYQARDLRLDRLVALKFLSPRLAADEAARVRLVAEAKAASALDHPNIAVVYEIAETEAGRPFIAMAWYEGETLKAKLARGPLPVAEALDLAIQLAEALAAAHRAGIIHRDVKPANVLVTREGVAKLVDFGIAKGTGAELTKEGTTLGTVAYMSPEQTRGQVVDARTDLWSLGVVLYEMLSGERPFRAEDEQALIYSIRHDEPPPPSTLRADVPGALDGIVGKLLRTEPRERYANAVEVLAALESAVPATSARVPTRRRLALSSWRSPRRLPRTLLSLGAALVFGIAGYRALGSHFSPPHSELSEIRSIAVLPLANLSADPEQEYFTDGMTEALIAELGKIGALKVISRTSAMRYRGTDTPVPQIARELGVEGLIEGSVLREADQVRITVQLIHGPSDRHLWAASYQRELRSVLALQSEVAWAIADQIRVRLTPAEQARLASARPVDPATYEAYLKGRYYLNRWPAPEHARCVEHFEQAIARDPNYADAYAGLAACHIMLAWISPPREVFPRARAAAQRALELEPNQAEAYAALGNVNLFHEWNWTSAEQNLRRALELNPNNAFARGSYSNYLVFRGRFEEAIREAKKAVELDPVSVWMNRNLSFVYQLSRRYADYTAQSRATLELAPENALASFDLAWSHALQGRREEAVTALSGRSVIGDAVVLATAGERGRALALLDQVRQQRSESYVDAFWISVPYAALGEADAALWWLEKAYQERSASMVQLRTNPALDALRSTPRFQALLRRTSVSN